MSVQLEAPVASPESPVLDSRLTPPALYYRSVLTDVKALAVAHRVIAGVIGGAVLLCWWLC